MNSRQSDISNLIPPFDNTRDVRFFFESSGHAEALSRLTYLVQDKTMGMGMLTGEIGCGKTLTRTVLLNRLDRSEFLTVTLENCLLEFDDLLLEVISQIRGERLSAKQYPDRYSRMAEYKRLLISECGQKHRHLVILLDEAQQLSDFALEALKAISNISSERVNFTTIILVGQPELRERVKALPQIDQRVSLRFHLNALSIDESEHYLAHRLRVAGALEQSLFQQDAVALIARYAQGIPRNINRISKLALDYVDARQETLVTRQIIEGVVRDLEMHSGLSNSITSLG